LILRKIIKNVATRCHILKLKCTKFDFVCMGLRPRPRWGSLQLTVYRPPIAGGYKVGRGRKRERKGKGGGEKGIGRRKGEGTEETTQ